MYKGIKRLMDIVLSGMLLVIGATPMLLVALLVKIDSKGPAIFKQQRLGVNGKVFNMYKFRSMIVNAEHQGSGVYSGKGDARVTRIGKILRATSIDELPQLVNIFKGEKYTKEQKKMFVVRPGITGWAQVNGRKEVEWPRRIEMNVWYVEHMSFALDMKILFKTVGKVFTNADNVNSTETAREIRNVKVNVHNQQAGDC